MKRSTRFVALALALGVAATGLASCGASGSSSDEVTIQVDWEHDEFAGTMLGFFPARVTVNPGMTIRFRQSWTGEPHTVTAGTRVEELTKPFRPLLEEYWTNGKIGDQPEGYEEFQKGLPFFFGQNDDINQAAAQPCEAATVEQLSLDKKCADTTLSPFTGDEAYWNSGFIPFEGERRNTFEMQIDPDAKPGTYLYYCNLHGAPMGGEITITDDGEPSKQADLNRQAKKEADRMAVPLLKQYRAEKAGKSEIKGNLAGSGGDETENVFGGVNEFTPRTIETTVGKKVTWTFVYDHTISFNVPKYAPIFKVADDGAVTFNEDLDKPAGGWPGRTPEIDYESDEDPVPVNIDAGEWDGTGDEMKSSGTGWTTGDKYSVTFTKKGTYPYACLIHPGMIGKVVVK